MTHNKKVFLVALQNWLPLAVTIVILSGLVYVAVQQNYRMSANDPQIQIAEDVASAITKGTALPENIVPPTPTADLTASLAPFVAIYSATGTPIGASVQLDGKLPTLPSGVLDQVKMHGENRLTWQPKSGVRIAAVITPYSGAQSGFVLAGRSLREVENRIDQLTKMFALGAALALVLSLLLTYFYVQKNWRHYQDETETVV